MITQYEFLLSEGERLPAGTAYRLYAWLLSQLAPQQAQQLHEQGLRPIAQHLHWDAATNRTGWRVALFGEEMETQAGAVLQACDAIELERRTLRPRLCSRTQVRPEDLIRQARQLDAGRTAVTFRSVTAFKQAGRYTIFPQERLILQSALSKWNAFFPQYDMCDEDAARMLESGLHIVRYSLHSTHYPLKGKWIPGFVGQIQLEARLPAPMQELWKTLALLLPYAGVGIKNALGMGGVQVEFPTAEKR